MRAQSTLELIDEQEDAAREAIAVGGEDQAAEARAELAQLATERARIHVEGRSLVKRFDAVQGKVRASRTPRRPACRGRRPGGRPRGRRVTSSRAGPDGDDGEPEPAGGRPHNQQLGRVTQPLEARR